VAAGLGFIVLPLGHLAFAAMNGDIRIFFTIWVVQNAFGMLTSAFVYSRVIVERFDGARGLALALATSAPPLAGAIAAPLIGAIIDAEGWRTAYLVLAAVTAIGGIFSISFLGRGAGAAEREKSPTLTLREFGALLRNPVLLLAVGGMLFVNIPQGFASSQLKLVVMDSGAPSATATWMVSLYATGVLIGRFLAGLALDRFKAHIVAFISLSLPAVGYCILAAHVTQIPFLAGAISLIGLAQGAEGDVGAYIISRRFDLKNVNLLVGLLSAMVGAGGVIGSVILSLTLNQGDSYTPFLLVAAAATLAGAALYALTGKRFTETPPAGETQEST
jgi:predicted MFS family arabinose efflux permease